jgi:hypothetical protein
MSTSPVIVTAQGNFEQTLIALKFVQTRGGVKCCLCRRTFSKRYIKTTITERMAEHFRKFHN